MSVIRHAIIDTAKGEVVDIIEAETDPASENHEVLVDTDGYRFLPSKKAKVGWTWTEEGGLKAGG